jgi:formate dehydrogenase subunit gamma
MRALIQPGGPAMLHSSSRPLVAPLRRIAAAGVLAMALWGAPTYAQAPQTPSAAQTSPSGQAVNPTARSAQESQLLKANDQVTGRVSIPDQKSSVLIQPDGREFRVYQTQWLPTIAAIAIFGMIFVIGGFYFYRGRIKIDAGPSGMTIVRFNDLERFAHWLTAVSFLTLAFTGLNTAFGRKLLLPLMGEGAFAHWSATAKLLHNFVAFPFMLSILLVFVLWVKDNFLTRVDIVWLKQLGGLFDGSHPPSEKFNFGEKTMFWSVILLGGALSATGILLLWPFSFVGVQGMQIAALLHALVGVLFFAAILAHIYIGSLGMEGAFESMGSGRVDVNWAKEHHSLWAEEELRKQTPQPVSGARPQPAE